jgi:hypothetical protein
VCPKGTRAEARPGTGHDSSSGDASWMVESGVLEGQALTFRRERKNGPISIEVRSLRPCRRALQHCFGQRGCNNDGAFAARGEREGDGREMGGRRSNLECKREQTEKA